VVAIEREKGEILTMVAGLSSFNFCYVVDMLRRLIRDQREGLQIIEWLCGLGRRIAHGPWLSLPALSITHRDLSNYVLMEGSEDVMQRWKMNLARCPQATGLSLGLGPAV
jgi:hypothetical protein